MQRNKSEWVRLSKQCGARSRAGIEPSSLAWTAHASPAVVLLLLPLFSLTYCQHSNKGKSCKIYQITWLPAQIPLGLCILLKLKANVLSKHMKAFCDLQCPLTSPHLHPLVLSLLSSYNPPPSLHARTFSALPSLQHTRDTLALETLQRLFHLLDVSFS